MSKSAPIRVAARLAGRPGRVLLHSGRDDDGCGRWSFATCEPVLTVIARGRSITLLGRGGAVEDGFEADPFATLQELVAEHTADWADDAAGPVPVAIGYLGYDLGRVVETLPPRRGQESGLQAPDMWFGLYEAVWRFDAATGKSDIVGSDAGARRALAEAISRGSDEPGAPPRLGPLVPAPSDSDAAHRQRVERIIEYIGAGDVYQVNLARRLVAPVLAAGDSLALYTALAQAAPAPFGALLDLSGPGRAAGAGEMHIVSGSPERFLARSPGSARLETRPIKGTRRRTGDPERDRALARELAQDEKERAEHLMIVDLERNDLGRVAETGSVTVEELGYVVELPTILHMVSRLACQVRRDVGVAEIFRSTFPGGSITGAPKIRAMEIIDELEPVRRGPYTGAIGYIGLRQAMDMSIAIRTAVLGPGELSLHVGGGIVADSTPERELEETEEKAAGWRAALAGLTRQR